MFESEKPLAERLRPVAFDDFCGQQHLVGAEGIIRKAVESGIIPSMIFWGPPGVGKTSLANVIANQVKASFHNLSAISAGVKDVREIIAKAKYEKDSIVFIDEIHRFSKSQQDALLAAVEKGVIKLIGATTENPSFEVNAALLSRSQVYVLKDLTEEDLKDLLKKAVKKDTILSKKKITLKEYDELFRLSGGDARRLLNLLELVVNQSTKERIVVTNKSVSEVAKLNPIRYDKGADMHYDVISAFIKSIRGSDPNGAVYWLARMIEGGEDPKFIARRLLILASEDIGIANPTAAVLANSCFQSVSVIGYPECRIILSQTAIYLATSPKSNSAYAAINSAQAMVRKEGNLPVPVDLRGAYTKLNKNLGYGQNYKYAHAFDGNFVDMEFLPEKINGHAFYEPANNSKEKSIREWLKKLWKKYNY